MNKSQQLVPTDIRVCNAKNMIFPKNFWIQL